MKDEIRKKLKIKRRYFQYSRREVADCNIADNFLNAYSAYNSFFIYNSFGSEADTHAIIGALVAAEKKVYLPRVDGKALQAVPFNKTQKGAFGIEEPIGEPYSGGIEVTVIPLLAVNERGFRIGYGGGFYDRYLKDKHTARVGLGYSFQIERFEEESFDERLDAFVCEKGIYYYGK